MSEPRHFTVAGIDALSEKERDVLGFIYIGQDGGHNRRTVESLIRKGWVVEYEDEMPGTGKTPIERVPMKVKRYTYSSIAAHIAWCEWCSLNESDEGDA